jgi:hypothetical protein
MRQFRRKSIKLTPLRKPFKKANEFHLISQSNVDTSNDNETSQVLYHTFTETDSNDNIQDIQGTVTCTNEASIELSSAFFESTNISRYFSSSVGGSKDIKTIDAIITRLTSFLVFTYHEIHQQTLAEKNSLEWFREVITSRYSLLGNFAEFLEFSLSRKASTIQSYLSDLSLAAKWLAHHSGIFSEHIDVTAFLEVLSMLRRNANKKKRKEGGDNTLEAAVASGQIPSGGLRDLQDMVESEFPWARSTANTYINKDAYSRFMELLFSCLYVFSVQGRVSGIADIKYGQRHDLLNANFGVTEKFKTNSKYGYQAIVTSAESKELLELYINRFRPCVNDHPRDEDRLWIRYNASAYESKHIGQAVSSFFLKKGNLKLNSTIIRSLIETEFEYLRQCDVITSEERQAVMNLNGHSSEIVKNYYLLQARQRDVSNAISAFTKGQEHRSAHPQACTLMHSQARNWGSSHPSYRIVSPQASVKWSDMELDYIGTIIDPVDSSGCGNYRYKRLLDIIKRDPNCTPIFHANHVTGVTKIRNGYDAYQARKGNNRKRKLDESLVTDSTSETQL